jgi:serine protease Do
MRRRPPILLSSLLLVLVLLVNACGGAQPAAETRAAPAPTTTPEPAKAPPTEIATPPPTNTAIPPTAAPTATAKPISSLENVKQATVRIEADGSFREPAGMRLNSASGGSGFIIDPSGLAVTNNHVVTGAAILKVWVAGEQEPRHARIVATSECSDLALIQIEGGDLPAVPWYAGDITPGIEVYAAGFPLGDPEYTLTHGIVSKARADGQTNWASVPAVIEHDAALNPGNSGGPLVTKDGEVVGVNYASDSKTRQYYAIARREADKVLQQLRQGKDVDSIGLNGEAFVSDDGKTSGIWVYSVKSGSPADKAGIQPGDILAKMEGVVLATQGTMTDYCDILRSHTAADTLSVEVVRFDTGATLDGQINGRELKEIAAAPTQPAVRSSQATPTANGDFVELQDDTGTLTVQVPASWSDSKSGAWRYKDHKVGVQVSAAPDLAKWSDGYDVNGAFFGVSRILAQESQTPDTLLDENTFKDTCTYEGRDDYTDNDNGLKGRVDVYSNCDQTGSKLIEIAAMPDDKSYIVFIQVIAVTEADVKALDNVIYTVDAANLPAGEASATPTKALTAKPAAVTAPTIQATIQKYDYSQWGRPAAMDDPNKTCGDFNNSRPVKKLTASLHVENRTGQPMKNWYGHFYKADGSSALTCYQGYDSGFPGIQPGKAVDITFSVYIEPNEKIAYGVLRDASSATSAKMYFP